MKYKALVHATSEWIITSIHIGFGAFIGHNITEKISFSNWLIMILTISFGIAVFEFFNYLQIASEYMKKKKEFRIKVPCDGYLVYVDKVFESAFEALEWARWNYKNKGEWYLKETR